MKHAASVLLAALCPLTVFAADEPIRFGEIRDGAVVATREIKMCAADTGYRYGFEIALPPGTHNVRGDMQWPAPPDNPNAGLSSRHAMDDYGDHSGRYVKAFTHDSDDQPGAWKLTILVDREPAATLDFTLSKAERCP